MKPLALALLLSLPSGMAMSAPQQLIDSVRAELNAWGLTDVSIAGLSSHKLSQIKHVLHSNSSPSAARGKVLAIIDPERYSIRSWFK